MQFRTAKPGEAEEFVLWFWSWGLNLNLGLMCFHVGFADKIFFFFFKDRVSVA
jgi:hypothetical protein